MIMKALAKRKKKKTEPNLLLMLVVTIHYITIPGPILEMIEISQKNSVRGKTEKEQRSHDNNSEDKSKNIFIHYGYD